MRVLCIFFINFYLIPFSWSESIDPNMDDKSNFSRPITEEFGIPYEQLNVTVLPELHQSNPNFDAKLTELTTKTKTLPEVIFEAEKEIASAALGEIAWPLGALIPIVESLSGLAGEQDVQLFNALKAVYDQVKIDQANSLVETVCNDIKKFHTVLDGLNKMIKGKTYPITKIDAKEVITISTLQDIQSSLFESVTKFSDGKSLMWKHPDLAARPLLLLATFISTFSQIRDLFYDNVIDNSIISCIMEENLSAYFPSILYWRLRHVVSANENVKVHDEVIYNIAYTPENFHDKHEWSRKNTSIRCARDCNGFDNKELLIKDKLHDDRKLCRRSTEINEEILDLTK